MVTLYIENKKDPLINDEAQELICFATVHEVKSWQALLDLYFQLKRQNSVKKVLFLLEDIGQCEYTSMHASMEDRLYFDTTELVKDDLDSSWDNVKPFEFQYHIQQLLKPEHLIEINRLYNKFNYSEQDLSLLIKINKYPEQILDEIIQVKLVDTTNETYKFAAQLNGYFAGDLNPFETFSLIQHLDQNFGLEYIGLGASLLFFIKTTRFNESKIDELLNELKKIYQSSQIGYIQLKQHLLAHQYLILPYVESLEIFDFHE